MRELMEGKGLNPEALGFAIGLSSHSVERVLNGRASDGRHATAVKRYLSIPNMVNVGGRLGVRAGGLAASWNGSGIEITKASVARDSYLQIGPCVCLSELTEGMVYSDGSKLLLRAFGKWWQPTGGGVRIYETNSTSFYELVHL